MASDFLDYTGLARFKEKMLALIEEKLAGKQNAGEYLTETKAVESGFVKYKNQGDARTRDSSKPTYGL